MGMDCLFVLMFSTLFLGLLVIGGNEVEIATFYTFPCSPLRLPIAFSQAGPCSPAPPTPSMLEGPYRSLSSAVPAR